MPWYYVGPDAKPVGPISLEDLQARRGNGAIAPETYIIEAPIHGAPKDWRRYRELFPDTSALPPLPSLPPVPVAPAAAASPHPLFPSAVPASTVASPGGPVFTGTHPSAYNPPYHQPVARTNACCAWGLGLSLAGLPCLFCGLGIFLALAGLALSVIGLIQVNRNHDQHGRGLAMGGIIAAIFTFLLVPVLVYFWMSSPGRTVVQMTTEQTSNDSDTR